MNHLTINSLSALSIQPDKNKHKLTNHISPFKQVLHSSVKQAGLYIINRNCLSNLIKLGLIGASLLVLPLSAHGVISAITSQTIQGTKPYFVLIDGTTRTPLKSINELLGFGYIDKDGNTKTADSSIAGTIVMVHKDMTVDQLITLVARDGITYDLNGVLASSGAKLGIDDKDGDATGVIAYGGYSAKLTKNGALVSATDTNKFDECSVYQLELKTINDETLGKIRAATEYGNPKYQDYTANTDNTVIYTLATSVPHACYAQPNLMNGTGTYAGAVEWDSAKGFLSASTTVYPTANNTGKNFPTTGFNHAYFNLTLGGTTAKQVIFATTASTGLSGTYTPVGSSVSVELSASDEKTNILKVKLLGPHDGDNHASIPKHVPTQFDLKSSTTNIVYSFKIDKWFIAKQNSSPYSSDNRSSSHVNTATAANETPKYCASLGGGGNKYRVPSVLGDYTNANVTVSVGGNTGGNYKREIGGGLFAEWGYTYNDYYTNSDIEESYYWASESHSSSNQYTVYSYHGFVTYGSPSNSSIKVACVSP